jgi:hypothetical protein
MFDGNDIDAAEPTALDLQDHLAELQTERRLAELEGLAGDGAYMADLDDEIAETVHAFTLVAVTEIATLRAELFGAQFG